MTELTPDRIDEILFDRGYGTEFPVGRFYQTRTGNIPSSVYFKKKFELGSIDKYTEGMELIYQNTTIDNGKEELSSQVFFNEKTNVLFNKEFQKTKKNRYFKLTIYYSNYQDIEQVIKELNNIEDIQISASIDIITSSKFGIESVKYELDIEDIDIKSNYGEKFIDVHNNIVKRLKEERKGLVLLHGEPGTGKTTYIKYLSKVVGKDVIFIPPAFSESLSNPEFVPFLMDNPNSILIIEDAEKVISDRGGKQSTNGVSNILNITDGILGDCLDIQIIATFNTSRDKIDSALLRKGRLISEYRFDKLSLEDTNNLLKKLGKGKSDKPLPLSDIYNYDNEVYLSKDNNSKIGFK